MKVSLSPLCGERVGVRGPLRWARDWGDIRNAMGLPASLRIAEGPPHPRSLRALDLSPHGGERCTLHFFSPRAAFSSEAVVLHVTLPTIAGSQPFDPPVADPVAVIRKQLCFDSVVAWRCTSNASDL